MRITVGRVGSILAGLLRGKRYEMMQSQMELIFGDDGSPLGMTPNEWGKVSEARTTSRGCEQKWSDVTTDRILAGIRRMTKSVKKMKKLEAPGVTVVAGKTAYAALREKFPEDIELVRIVECAYLGENECFAIKNEAVK